MKRGVFAIAVLAAAAVMTACAGGKKTVEFDPQESCLFLSDAGTVTAVTVETFDGGSYSEEELKASTEEYLAAFNGADAGLGAGQAAPAELEECTLGEGSARLKIRFADAGQYLRFMKEYPDEESAIRIKKLDVVPVPEGVTKGYIVGASFTEADGKKKSVSAGDIMEKTKLYVAAVEGPALIVTEGAVRYVSSGAAVTGTNQVQTGGDGVAYIVFE